MQPRARGAGVGSHGRASPPRGLGPKETHGGTHQPFNDRSASGSPAEPGFHQDNPPQRRSTVIPGPPALVGSVAGDVGPRCPVRSLGGRQKASEGVRAGSRTSEGPATPPDRPGAQSRSAGRRGSGRRLGGGRRLCGARRGGRRRWTSRFRDRYLDTSTCHPLPSSSLAARLSDEWTTAQLLHVPGYPTSFLYFHRVSK